MENERATNICPRCNDTHFVHGPTGEVICDTCGLVIQTASLVVAEVFSRDGVSTGAKIPSNSLCSTSASKKRKGESAVERTAGLFQLNAQLTTQCLVLLKDLQSKANLARDSSLLAAGVVLFVLKTNNRPVSITDMAKRAKVNIFDLGRVYGRIEKMMQTSPEVHHSMFVNLALTSLNLDDKVASIVRKQADQLIDLAKSDCIATGRHPSAVIAAALYLSLEAYYAKMQIRPTYITGIAEALVVSERTIKSRAAEIKKLLVAKYHSIKDMGGFQIKVTKNRLIESIPDMLMMIDVAELHSANKSTLSVPNTLPISSTNATNPPSFLHNQKQRERRALKLENAKQRLLTTLMEVAPVDKHKATKEDKAPEIHQKQFQDYDEEDRTIEMLLLQGVPDDAILTGYYNSDPTSCGADFVNIGSDNDNGDSELGEHDLPDEDLYQFVRPENELEHDETIYNHQAEEKVHVPTTSVFKRKCFSYV